MKEKLCKRCGDAPVYLGSICYECWQDVNSDESVFEEIEEWEGNNEKKPVLPPP